MNEIVMIPIKQLEHHPENPRKDLGDLTELAESIRKNGVMQNLTVVMHDPMRVPPKQTPGSSPLSMVTGFHCSSAVISARLRSS